MPAFQPMPDRMAGYPLAEVDWDLFKDNMNTATIVKLGDVTLGAPASEIEFASIDLAWSSLMIKAYLRGTTGGSGVSPRCRFNSDTGSNYDSQYVVGQAAGTSAGEALAGAFTTVGLVPAAGAAAGLFGAITALTPGYSSVALQKVIMSKFSYKAGTSTNQLQSGSFAGFWRSTTVISNVKLYPASGDWAAGCRAALYAIP